MDLAFIKKHLNIDDSFTGDDDYIEFLDTVAIGTIEKHIDISYNELLTKYGEIPTPILQAELLYIGNLYNSREAVTFGSANEIPFTYDYLLALYKDYSKKEEVGGIFG